MDNQHKKIKGYRDFMTLRKRYVALNFILFTLVLNEKFTKNIDDYKTVIKCHGNDCGVYHPPK